MSKSIKREKTMINLMNKPLLVKESFLEVFLNSEKGFVEPQLSNNDDGIVTIFIHGLLTKRDDFSCVSRSYDSIKEDIKHAIDDEDTKAILLDIDSPGGEVGGLFDLVDYIQKARTQKPIYSYVNDNAFSAAYAIASAASKIFINRTSGVGSIGVIATYMNISEADKKMGVKYTTIFAGEKKNDLSPHEELGDTARADLQAEVDRLYEIFVSTVAKNRGITEGSIRATKAGCFYGDKAIEIGLADEKISEEPVEMLKKFGGASDGVVYRLEGKKMATEEHIEEQIEDVGDIEKYRCEVLEITKLCKLAHAENRISEFIEKKLGSGGSEGGFIEHNEDW